MNVQTRSATPSAAVCPDTDSDTPVRVEVAMPRHLYDRLTAHDDAPRCRYETATGRAEFVAEPGPAHEWRAHGLSYLFLRIEEAVARTGHPVRFFAGGATRLLSDDGAFEPDASLFVDPPDEPDLLEFDGYLDTRLEHPVPDLVVEIDRRAAASRKLTPYFRMGVREAWTWSRADGARIWTAAAADAGFRAADRSLVLPGLDRDDIDRLLAGRRPPDRWREVRDLAARVAHTMLAESGRPRRSTSRTPGPGGPG